MIQNFDSKLEQKIKGKWEHLTPSLQIQAYHCGQKKIDLKLGHHYKYFDLASLTKVLFTSRVMMSFYEKNFWSKETQLINLLDWWKEPLATVVDLLTHHAGLEWWKPFYVDLNQIEEDEVARMKLLEDLVSQVPIQKSSRSVYSDLDMFVLGFIIQRWTSKSLLEIWNEDQKRWQLNGHLHFIENFKKNKNQSSEFTSLYAPTEFESGVVHDENAKSLGGVAPHAGLFGSVDDVSEYILRLRDLFYDHQEKENSSLVVKPSTVRYFLSRAIHNDCGDWALGWMMPSLGSSSSGKYFDGTSVGHTGFTGTSIWWDLKKDLFIIILSNRVALGRDNKAFAQFRPILHDQIFEVLNLC